MLGIRDAEAMREAIRAIGQNVRQAQPGARIEGYELQEQIIDGVEAMAGFTAAAPFGPMIVLGSGGTLVELIADRAVALAPLEPVQAQAMLHRTKLDRILAGYRNLMPPTDTSALVALAVKLSHLANDFDGVLAACDLNPVLIRKGSGDLRVVDALLVRA
jgi:hypothetical protein